MAHFKLTDKEWDALDEFRFSITDVVPQRNHHFDVGSEAVQGVHRAGIGMLPGDRGQCAPPMQGLAGLQPRKSTGRRSRATPEYRKALRQAVQTQPSELGYDFSVWSVGRLNAHLKKETGISFGDDRLRAILREEGFSFQRPKHTMKGKRDEARYETARRQLKRLKKGRLRKLATPC
jgi:transposase